MKVEFEVDGTFIAVGEHEAGGGRGCTFSVDQAVGRPINLFVSMEPEQIRQLAPLFLQRVRLRVSVEPVPPEAQQAVPVTREALPPLLAATTDGILVAFRGLVVRASTEAELGAVVRRVLAEAGIPYVAEAELGRRSRIDFLVGRTGIELKIDGGASALLRQLDRYAASDKLDALVVVTTRRMLARGLPSDLRGKPIACVVMGAL
jgi:hypothetical protein